MRIEESQFQRIDALDLARLYSLERVHKLAG
jgi:hypothetical protein